MPRHAFVVTGLGFGDEGKGTIVDYLTRLAYQEGPVTVVRHSGGAQAGHNVVAPYGGGHHTFAQFGAGSLMPGVRTHLSRFMMIDPPAMYNEAEHLQSVGAPYINELTTVDARCLITTPAHKWMNMYREFLRGNELHGSCLRGIGETRLAHMKLGDDALFAKDCKSPTSLANKMESLVEYAIEWARSTGRISQDEIEKMVEEMGDDLSETLMAWSSWIDIVSDERELDLRADEGTLIFEGAQGVLLDEDNGFHPHTTWSRTGSWNARVLLDEIGDVEATYIGVTRNYSTRHGAGPFVSNHSDYYPADEEHNDDEGAQGEFRTGAWDALATKYAKDCEASMDFLAITCLDQWDEGADDWYTCDYYEYQGTLPDLDPYFAVDSKDRITAIKAVPFPDPMYQRSHQEAITNRLLASTPVFDEHHDYDEDYVCDYISSILDVPVLIRSAGSTSVQKVWMSDVPIAELVA